MRLLNVNSFKLEQFYVDIPSYAILSHTWGKNEVTFDEFPALARTSPRLWKTDRCCLVTRLFGLNYVWIDTFCINKDSSSELSESINSMYRWYKNAEICIAYLSDVEGDDIGEGSAFRRSRWFTRGWTLQELVAPQNMIFLDSEWKAIGQRGAICYDWMTVVDGRVPRDVSIAVHKVTGIRAQYLEYWNLHHMEMATVAEKMSWAAKRQTTRPEDMAYSLLGIFNISMPLLYGEGGGRALVRLQEEITKQLHDLTIFAWGFGLGPTSPGIFATSLAHFAGCGRLTQPPPTVRPRRSHYTVTNLGVQTTARYVPVGERVCYLLLDTVSTGDDIMAVPMTRSDDQGDILERSAGSVPLFVPSNWLAKAHSQQVYLAGFPPSLIQGCKCLFSLCRTLRRRGYRMAEVYPPHAAIGPMENGKCETNYWERFIIVRFTSDRPDQFCAGIYKSDGRWHSRMLKCDPTTTIAELLVGTVNESHIRELVEKWDPTITGGSGGDTAARILENSRSSRMVFHPDGEMVTIGEGEVEVALYVWEPSGCSQALS